ncbi:hypothetical protein COCNU_14G007710 [Cocos nucifera]|uniref:Uncharacterized protein n=1 Tax=Cocos nucifera TaxID=13894 RepID=A0A8K0IVK7_COCNU|nr:hypothetical protein COCNU_14G007710 [Cocos nucifera]
MGPTHNTARLWCHLPPARVVDQPPNLCKRKIYIFRWPNYGSYFFPLRSTTANLV